jgi:predicted TIM-barrel fold metal-dependent hydrolase
VDLPFYRRCLEDFLPEHIIDMHSHVGRMQHVDPTVPPPTFWADRMCAAFCAEALLRVYRKLLPGKLVHPVFFAFPRRNVRLDQANAYTGAKAQQLGAWSLLVTRPSWTPAEVLQRVQAGGHAGLKPYPYLADGIPANQVTIFDCLPHPHLDLANRRGWFVILHIPRAERLADPVNLSQIKEICAAYPRIKLVIAHVGRAYCPRYAVEGLSALRTCTSLYYDISGNCNQDVFELLIRFAGPQRILFGSDLPIVALRLRRACAGDKYINYVRHTRFVDDQTQRDLEHEDSFTFFLYESLAAFRRASAAAGLSRSDVEDVFYNNAHRLLPSAVAGVTS